MFKLLFYILVCCLFKFGRFLTRGCQDSMIGCPLKPQSGTASENQAVHWAAHKSSEGWPRYRTAELHTAGNCRRLQTRIVSSCRVVDPFLKYNPLSQSLLAAGSAASPLDEHRHGTFKISTMNRVLSLWSILTYQHVLGDIARPPTPINSISESGFDYFGSM